MRLIDADALIDALNTLFKKQVTQFGYEGYEKADEKTQLVCDGISYSIGCVLNLPSAQPQRMKGKWDARGWNNAYWKCSNCDELTVFPFDFCPFCGSDMRGDEDAAD